MKDMILITDTYPRCAIDHPPITEPHIETPCPTMPVQNPTHEADIFLSIRNKGTIFRAPCSPENIT